MGKNDDVYEKHEFERFCMVAAMPNHGGPPLTEDEQKEYQPHYRHPSHVAALYEAHRLANKFQRPFAVLKSSTLALPVSESSKGETDGNQE